MAEVSFIDLLRQLIRTHAGANDQGSTPSIVSVTRSIAGFEPLDVFRHARRSAGIHDCSLWEQAAADLTLVGIGAAARFVGEATGRWSQVAEAWRATVAHAVVDAATDYPFPAPLSLGGFAFDPSPPHDAAWSPFPDGLLVLPRLLFTRHRGRCWLTINAMVAGTNGDREIDTLEAAAPDLAALFEGEPPETERPGAAAAVVSMPTPDEEAPAEWRDAVAAIVEDIREGTVEKQVLARRVRLRASRGLNPDAVLKRLRSGFGASCTVFAVSRGGACFVGASPERLVRLDGRVVRADSLAGSTARGRSADEDRVLGDALVASDKEQLEHALVVRALRETLAPLCSELHIPERPTLLRMPNVQHLHTPVEGTLRRDTDIFELGRRLHPTPAVGGVSRDDIATRIRRGERFDRGWYAGPVGWVDARGGGELVIAIRSALLQTGTENVESSPGALLYAGCGIVTGSDPDAEYRESCLKLRPLVWAINGAADGDDAATAPHAELEPARSSGIPPRLRSGPLPHAGG